MSKKYYVEGYHPSIRDHTRLVALHLSNYQHACEVLEQAVRAGWYNLEIKQHN